MGNEKSVPSGLKTEEIIKITDDWIQKSATLSNDSTKICIFEQFLKEDNIQTLQKMSKVRLSIIFVLIYHLPGRLY